MLTNPFHIVIGALLAAFGGFSTSASAELTVLTTTTDLAALVKEVGGSGVAVDAIARGTQDPHFIEAKPSFMLKASKADLLVSVGLDLEVGYLPAILRGARNPKILPGSKGYLEVGLSVDRLDVASGKVTRAEGDVHPDGNPHFNLDPIRMGEVAKGIAVRLSEIDPPRGAEYLQRAQALQNRLKAKTVEWTERIKKSGVRGVVTYHKTLTYFLNRFSVEGVDSLEPKPGIPPTSGHILSVIQKIKEKGVKLILIENYFDPAVAKKVQEAIPQIRVEVVPVAVDGAPGTSNIEGLIEEIVKCIEGKR